MKKTLASIILAALTLFPLASCNTDKGEGDYYDRDYPVQVTSDYSRGFLYSDTKEGMIKLFDYESRTLMPFCAVPNCLHRDSSCTAIRKFHSFLFIYHNKLYDICSEVEAADSAATVGRVVTTVRVSDTDGNNEQILVKFDGEFNNSFSNSNIFNGSLYFTVRICQDIDISDGYSYGNDSYAECKFMKLDLSAGKITDISSLAEGYHSQGTVVCMTPHKAYISTIYTTETAVYEDFDSVEEWIEATNKIVPINVSCSVDLETEEKTEGEEPPIDIKFIYDSHYFDCGSNGIYAYDADTKEFKRVFDIAGYTVADVIEDRYALLLKDDNRFFFDSKSDKITQLPDYANVQEFAPEVFYGDYCFGSVQFKGDTDDYFISGYGYCKTDDMFDENCEFTVVYSSEIGLGS